MKNVFVLGSLNMDFIVTVEQMPKLGETIQGKGFQSSPGGKGANQAVALAKQGVKPYMIGCVGDDMIGDDILQSLQSFGVHSDYVQRVVNQTSGIAMIILEDDDNRIITSSGANALQDIDTIKAIINQFASEGDYFLVQLEIPMEIIETSIILAHKKGMKTILNAAPFKEINQSLLSHIDILIVNETEAEKLLKTSMRDLNPENMINQLIQIGPREVILTLGKKGSYYSNGEDTFFTPVYEVNQVIDTTGAGDAFIGCFIANQMSGKPIDLSLKYASACSALTIQKKGVHHAIPDVEQLESFIRNRGASYEKKNNTRL